MRRIRNLLVVLATAGAVAAPITVPSVPLPSVPNVPAAETPREVTLPPARNLQPAAPLSAIEREAAVELPPMIVAESSKSPPWLYAKVGEAEYLSRCSASTTRAFITSQLETYRILRVFAPPDFWSTTAVPIVSIVSPLVTGPGGDDAVLRELRRMEKESAQRANEEGRADRRIPHPETYRFMPNLRLDDRDMMAVFTFLNEREFRRDQLIAAPDFVYVRLVYRTPTLPLWLIEGLTSLYVQASLRQDPITMESVRWLSAEDTAGLRRDPESRRVLLPANELFAFDAVSGTANRDPLRLAVWRAQCALFVRWALDPANTPAASSLWQLARRVSIEPITEAIFTECFGFGYADLRDRLSDYLPTAVKQPARIMPGRLPPLPSFELKPATPQQIARLRGEWERLEIPLVAQKHPEFLSSYVDQARATLRKAAGRGDRDPQLFAALGLCELDAGDAVAARPWLEQAAANHVTRPRVYFELARLRWADLTRATGENTGYTVTQLQPILEPLRIALSQSPLLPEVHALMADAWLRCSERVVPTDLPALRAAAPLFRRIPAVGYRIALLQARHRQFADAAELLRTGELFLTEAKSREQFAQLRAAIVAAASKPTTEAAARPVTPSR